MSTTASSPSGLNNTIQSSTPRNVLPEAKYQWADGWVAQGVLASTPLPVLVDSTATSAANGSTTSALVFGNAPGGAMTLNEAADACADRYFGLRRGVRT